MIFIEVKALAGSTYVRATDVIAVQGLDPKRCSLVLRGGTTLPCSESSVDVAARIEATLAPPVHGAEGDK